MHTTLAVAMAWSVLGLAACAEPGPTAAVPHEDAGRTSTPAADGGGTIQRAPVDPPPDAGPVMTAHVSSREAMTTPAAAPNPTQAKPDLDDTLCDGSPGITFAAAAIGGGQPVPGTEVMSENGHSFILIEGTCRYWVLRGRLEHVVTGELSASDVSSLREDFRLERWHMYVGDYPQRGFDAPGYEFVFGRSPGKTLCPSSGCVRIGTGTGAATGLDISWLLSVYQRSLERLVRAGNAAHGDIRYLLVAGESAIVGNQWNKPASWPLGDPAKVAISQMDADNGYAPGTSRLARGADADALREVWRQFLDYEISGREKDMPAGSSLAIPVEVDSTHYQLFLRDSIPLEDEHGLIAY